MLLNAAKFKKTVKIQNFTSTTPCDKYLHQHNISLPSLENSEEVNPIKCLLRLLKRDVCKKKPNKTLL